MIERESLQALLQLPSLDRFSYTVEEKEQLLVLIRKFKEEQLVMLIEEIVPLLEFWHDDNEIAKSLWHLAIINFENIDTQALVKIFQVQHATQASEETISWQEDSQVKVALSELLPQGEIDAAYRTICNFRHRIFLDKRATVRNNEKAYLERRSEHYLGMNYDRVPLFLRPDYRQLTAEQRLLLDKFYPAEQLKKKLVRKAAQEELGLTLFEIQSIIVSIIRSLIESGSLSKNLKVEPLSGRLLEHHNIYTNAIAKQTLREAQFHVNLPLLPVNSCDYYTGRSLLMEALKNNDEIITSAMLLQGAIARGQDVTGYTVLHYGIECGIEVFKELLAKNAEVDAVDEGGYSAIYLAAEAGELAHVQALLSAGANPNLAGRRYNYNALHIAVVNGHLDVVKALVASGKVELNAVTRKNQTAMQLAATVGQDMVALLPSNQQQPSKAIDKEICAQLQLALQGPRENYAYLNHIAKKYSAVNNPFWSSENFGIASGFVFTSVSQDIAAYSQIAAGANNFFNEFIQELRRLSLSHDLSLAAVYSELYNHYLIGRAKSIPPLAFAFEVIRCNFLQHYIYLSEGRTPLQVAIDTGDVAVFRQLLISSRSRGSIRYRNQNMSDVEYAILMGKVAIITEWQALGMQYPHLYIASNALELAQARELELNGHNPAFLEAEEFQNTTIVKDSRYSWKKLLRNLQRTLPASESKQFMAFLLCKNIV